MKYLIAEDDPNLRLLWKTRLTAHGYSVSTAASADEARAALETEFFDVMVLDLYLGRECGLGLVTCVERLNPACKVIVVTGTATMPDHELRTMTRSVVSVHRKPVDIEDLLDVCGRIDTLGARRALV